MPNQETTGKKVIIVGGVAGGATVAARLRRLDEHAEILMFERGEHVSFANCGLPYHIGGEIKERQRLLLHTPQSLKQRFNIDVRVKHEVLAIDRQNRKVTVKNNASGQEFVETYDYLVLSPGAAPLRPAIPGIDLPQVLSLRDVSDMDRIIAGLHAEKIENIVVVGGGFIGLEMIEQLHHRFSGRSVKLSLIEAAPHILAPFDSEMITVIEGEMRKNGIDLYLNDPLDSFSANSKGVIVSTKSGKRIPADLVIFNIGVRPETGLAVAAGLELGARGGVKVDSQMRTSDPNIFALGDCVETKNLVTGEFGIVPLAGPANRQGRIVADVICGLDSHYKGTLGTAILRVFSRTAAVTGVNERTLKRLGLSYKVVYLHPGAHAGYYPGATPISLKLIFEPQSGKIFGAQAVGVKGIDKRIDIIATAIRGGLTVEELTEVELCYAPPFGSAKDPVNVAGMLAQNVERELVELVHPAELEKERAGAVLLDVRDPDEREGGYIPDSIHIPLNEIRARISEIPKDKPLIVYCQSGQRSYTACRILMQHGYHCKNLTGAWKTWSAVSQAS